MVLKLNKSYGLFVNISNRLSISKIAALETSGIEVKRFGIRGNTTPIIDKADQKELEKRLR